ncbi:hypothetical protein ACGH2B_18240 [Streptomyces sp. BBFR2]|uniref:hypothetical protein n=1 Tax=Streptomyces sp. BBFR2 TaxID=3372854 RepID=UPI0037D9FCD7
MRESVNRVRTALGPLSRDRSYLILRLRAKRLGGPVTALALSAVLGGIWGAFPLVLPSFTEDSGKQTTLIELLPLLTGAAVALSCRSDLSAFEDAAPREEARLQRWHLLSATVIAALVQYVSFSWGAGDLAQTGLRNYLGFLGVSLIAATLIGYEKFWVAPLVIAFPAFFIGSTSGTFPSVLWSWPTLPATNTTSWLVAACWLVCGAVSFLFRTSPRVSRLRMRVN